MTKQEADALYEDFDVLKKQVAALTKRVEELEGSGAEAKARSQTPGWWKAPEGGEQEPLPPGQGRRG